MLFLSPALLWLKKNIALVSQTGDDSQELVQEDITTEADCPLMASQAVW